MISLREIRHKYIPIQLFVKIISTYTLTTICLLLVSCAPSLYSINIRYEQSKATLKPTEIEKKYPITIASFNDIRPGGDDLLIGKVITSGGNQIPIIPKNSKPSKAVASSLREYMLNAGYTLTEGMPSWNLKENTIKKEWGRIMIGGNIDKLDIICIDNIPIKRYKADANLTLFFADVQKQKIFYTISVAGATTLEHVRFSEEILEQQMNDAMSSAIEDIFGSNTFQTKLREVLSQSPDL